MEKQQHGISPHTAQLPFHCLKQMIQLVRDLQNLSENPAYPPLLTNLPENALVDPGYFSVLMGYDFHIDETQQVKLIEVNTNAGGLWYAARSYAPDAQLFPSKLGDKLLSTFLQEYRLFRQDKQAQPQLIAIIDHQPEQQFLYPEMQVFAKLFQQAGIKTVIVDPAQLEIKDGNLCYQGQAIDLIYNRHCDFYLNAPEMQHIAAAWQQQMVCLTPNPRVYGLLADKQRMADWSHAEFFNDLLDPTATSRLQQVIPYTQLLHAHPKETLWAERKQKVFKPTTGYASRGVYVGDKLTKSKLKSLEPHATLVQHRIKPSITHAPDGEKFKTDFRLFVYRKTILAVSARLYQGQVTNLRTANGGFSKIKLT